MSYFQQQEESQIRAEYKHKHVCIEIARQLDIDSSDFKSFYQEAIHNIDTIPEGEEKLAEAIKEYGKISGDFHHKATTNILEFYAKWIAESLVDSKMENMPVEDMQNDLDGKQDESPQLFANNYVRSVA